MHSNSVAILFIKAPLPGMAKSRLAAGIGAQAAADLYRLFILDAVDMLGRTSCAVRIYFSPADAADVIAEIAGRKHPLLPQAGDDLGQKMENAFLDAFSSGYERAVLVGSDIPELSHTVIAAAFDALDRNDAVLGPAADGGYYLVGFRKDSLLPDVFRGIPWSTSEVFDLTVGILQAKHLGVHLLPRLGDVDSLSDLKAFRQRSRHAGLKSRATEYLEKNRKFLFGEL